MTTTRKKAAEALALAAPAAVEAEMLPGDAERMVDAVLRAIREPSETQLRAGGAALDYPSVYMGGASENGKRRACRVYYSMIDSIIAGEG